MGFSGVTNLAALTNQFETWIQQDVKQNVDKALAETVAEVTAEVQQEAKARVPQRSGDLVNAIQSSISADGQTGKVFVDKTQAYYGFMVEFGTEKMAAQPFLRSASDAKLPGFIPKLKTKLGE
jgi:HK97 gp10 family phage protein